MLETVLVTFTTLFAVIGPIDVAAVFSILSADDPPAKRRGMAVRGVLIAAIILLAFGLFGEALLNYLGISLAALRTAGGILLLLIGIDLTFARSSAATSTTEDEETEAVAKQDISVFPLATPLIAGPGAMGAIILLMSSHAGDIQLRIVVLLTMLGVLLLTLLLLLGATQINRILGLTGLQVITRVFGVLLSALAVQFLFDGIAGSGLLS